MQQVSGITASRRLVMVATFLAICVALSSPPLDATTVLPVGLDVMSAEAFYVFAGTVSGIEVIPDESAGLVSKVSFTDLRFSKGASRDPQLILTMRGGTLNGTTIVTDGLPQFRVGSRYVVLADSSLGSREDYYFPIIGFCSGLFEVKSDPSGRAGVVHDWQGRPLARIDWPRMDVVVKEPPPRPEPTKRDSIRFSQPSELRRPLPPGVKPGGHVIRVERSAPSEPTDGVAGTEVDERGRDVVRMLTRRGDPGTRVSEYEFLSILARGH